MHFDCRIVADAEGTSYWVFDGWSEFVAITDNIEDALRVAEHHYQELSEISKAISLLLSK